MDSWIFKFNNLYLYDSNGKDFWNIGISYYNKLMNDYKKKENITLNLTKNNIDFDFNGTSNDFINSLFKLYNYKSIISILKSIDEIDKNFNIYIPFDFYYEKQKVCSFCNQSIISYKCQKYQNHNKFKEKKVSR